MSSSSTSIISPSTATTYSPIIPTLPSSTTTRLPDFPTLSETYTAISVFTDEITSDSPTIDAEITDAGTKETVSTTPDETEENNNFSTLSIIMTTLEEEFIWLD